MRRRVASHALAVSVCTWALLPPWSDLLAADQSGTTEVKPTERSAKPTVPAARTDRLAVGFSPEVYLGHIYYLASDELGGRGVGTVSIERAGQYIADQFASAGIEPGGEDSTYFQTFDIDLGAEIADEAEFGITGAETDPLVLGEHYTPFPWSSDEAFAGEVVFVGYGLVDPERNYDDYAGLDVTGKVVLMLRREPTEWPGPARRHTRLARFDNKVATAREHGAAAVLIANQKSDQDRLVPFVSRGAGDYGLPAFHVKRALADEMLAAAGLDSLEQMQARLDGEPAGHCSAALPGVRANGRAAVVRKTAPSRNVIGLIRGQGPLAEEYLVIGAHYDHVGRTARRSWFGRASSSAKKEVHNGADDNASGTAGVIELGKALARQSSLKRSVLLIAFTGEESGLLGSRHFADHPTVPIENIVACLNLDMIGRMKEGEQTVHVYGTGTAGEFDGLIRRLAEDAGLLSLETTPAAGISDDASFYRKKIPAMHFFTGLHADYHRPSDDSDKINEQDAVRIVGLVYGAAREIIDADQRPTYHEAAGFASMRRRGNRVVMGVFPDYGSGGSGPGLLIEGVVPSGPAAKAGMKNGDRIVRISDQQVDRIEDYIGAIRSNKAGDQVEVVVARDGEEITLTVTLGAG